jgi:predicted alpha/beta superfamily hydrolase
MKHKLLLLFLLTLLFISGYSQNANKDKEIVIGDIDQVYSKILKENRKIWVYVPNGADPNTNDKERFPVVYLLDGNAHFFSTMGINFHLSQLVRNMINPKMIIVGIPNTNRNRDLTPSHASYHPPLDSAEVADSGGGENFLAFIEKELIPHIDSLYPTTSYKTLIGHSFGGLFAINTLINHPDLFNAYVAIDPSMSWDDQKLLKQSKEVLKENKFKTKRFLFLRLTILMQI